MYCIIKGGQQILRNVCGHVIYAPTQVDSYSTQYCTFGTVLRNHHAGNRIWNIHIVVATRWYAELGKSQYFSFATTTTWQRNRASGTWKLQKMLRCRSLNKGTSHNKYVQYIHNAITNKCMAWKQGHVGRDSVVACPAQVVWQIWL